MPTLLFNGKLTGVSFEPAKTNVLKLRALLPDKVQLFLHHDVSNAFDKAALRVMATTTEGTLEIGWIPAFVKEKADWITEGLVSLKVVLIAVDGFDGKYGVRVQVLKL